MQEIDTVEEFEIQTQVVKILEEENRNTRPIRPDVQIKDAMPDNQQISIHILCEHKLDSDERSGQLADYAKSMTQDREALPQKPFNLLVFITYSGFLSEQTTEFFNQSWVSFLSLRWSEVYELIEHQSVKSKNPFVIEFCRYMEELNMNMPKQIDPLYLGAIAKLPEIVGQLDGILKKTDVWNAYNEIPKIGNERSDHGYSILEEERWVYIKGSSLYRVGKSASSKDDFNRTTSYLPTPKMH